jgi:CheY-like chemotaxis protein
LASPPAPFLAGALSAASLFWGGEFLFLSTGDVAMGSPTALCIDDRPQVLELRKATLESHGYCVKIAASGYAAMKMLEETSVAAVLLEYKQEGMDSEAIACHVKQRFPNLPIILLSAYCEMPERILWLVDEYVMKSELSERLVPTIERVTCPINIEEPHKFAPRSHEQRKRNPAA